MNSDADGLQDNLCHCGCGRRYHPSKYRISQNHFNLEYDSLSFEIQRPSYVDLIEVRKRLVSVKDYLLKLILPSQRGVSDHLAATGLNTTRNRGNLFSRRAGTP